MPKVAQFGESKVSSQVVKGPRAQNMASFGIGDAAQQIAPVVNAGLDFKKQVDTTNAESALVNFERDKNDLFFNPESGYFNTQGINAFDGAQGTSQSLDKLKQQYSDGLSSGESKRLFDKAAGAHVSRANADIMRHSAKGFQTYEVATMAAQTENTLENASLYWNDPDRLKVQATLGEQSIIDSAAMQGLGAEATNEKLQNYRSAFATNSITAATASSAAEGQKALDESVKRKLVEGPDKVNLDKIIAGKFKVEETQFNAQQSVLMASKFNRDHDNRTDIKAEVDKIDDPVLRKKTMSESMYQFNQKEIAKSEGEEGYYNEGIDFITQGGSAEEFQAANPAAWEGMNAVQRNNMVNGKHMTTDQVQFNNVMSLPNNELGKLNAADYAGVFKPTDVSKLRTAIDKARKGFSNTSVQSAASKTNAIAEQFFGKKATWKNKTKAPKVQALMEAVENSLEEAEGIKGSKLSPTEINDVLSNFTRELVIERSTFGIDYLSPDDDVDISNTPPEQVEQLNRFVRANGEGSYQQVMNELNKRGVPVNVDTIISTYRQATQ